MARVRQKTRGDAEEAAPTRGMSNRMIALVVVAAVVVLVIGLMAWLGRTGGQTATVTTTGEGESLAAAGTMLGDPSAPLLIVDYSDFRCPHCKDAATNLTPKIITDYVETGKARLQFVPVTVLGEEALLGAQAALCAEEQGAFWPYHDRLFARQGLDQFNMGNLANFASDLGLDEQRLRDCVLSGQFRQQIDENNRAFQQSGGTGTPTFVIGEQLISGSQPYETVQPIIEAELERLGVEESGN